MATDTKPAPKAESKSKAITPFEEVRNSLMSDHMKSQLVMALPPQMPPEKFQRVAVTAMNKNPDLLDCTRASLYGAFMLAAQDGLLPDGREAAIVKYMNHGEPCATYMPMVGGLLKKIRNSGELKQITAQIVYRADQFEYWVDDTGEHLNHRPEVFGERGEIIGVYALAKTKDDAVYIEVMSQEEVEKIRSVSKAKGSGPWTQWWDQMAKKTAIRRLSKRLPMSTDLDEFIRRDDHLFDTEAKVTDAEPKHAPGTPGRLQKLMGEPATEIEGTAAPAAPKGQPVETETKS